MHQQLPPLTRLALAVLLAAAGIAYSAVLVASYVQTTAPSAVAPELGELNRLLFHAARPVGPMERRLEAADTPLGTGPLISVEPRVGPLSESTMRITSSRPLTAAEVMQRE